MKSLFALILVLIIFCPASNATNYYISSSGNDANSGTSTGAAWKTVSKVSGHTFSPGDQILFNRGDVFYGSITIASSGTSGNPITFGAYGSGANPVITGFTNVTAWTNLGSNIWESTSALSTLSTCNMVVINGVNTAMGRTPNTGYYTYSSSNSTSLTSSSLNSSTINWTGAQAVIKKERYIIDRSTITSAFGSTINYSSSSYTGHPNWGFFIQNDSRTLDQQNEWYYNPSTKKIRVYSTSAPTDVKISTHDTLLYAVNRSYIIIDGVDFTGGNQQAFYLGNFSHSIVQNCNFDFNYNTITGYQLGSGSSNFTIDNCTFNHTNNNAISLPSEFAGTTITNNLIKNSGVIVGMSGSGDGQAQGLNVTGANYLIQYNEIDSTGYVALGFNGSNVLCKNNFVNYFCTLKDDGGGIYTGNPQSGVVISNNIVLNGIGNDEGTNSSNNGKASGIYCDDNSSGMTILNNSVANVAYAAIFLHQANNITVRGNTTYNNEIGLLVDADNSSYTTNINCKQNIFVAKTTGKSLTLQNQLSIWFRTTHTTGNDIRNFGTVDSNYYARPFDDNLTIMGTVYTVADNSYSVSSWRTYSGFDLNSNKSPKTISDINDLRFEYNSTASSITIILDGSYIDVKNSVYNGSVTLAPYTSIVLIRNGAVINPPKANAGNDQTITLPLDSINLSGSGTVSNGTISSYQWTKISGPANYNIMKPASAITEVTGFVKGVYQFELSITDSNGFSAKDTIKITVNAANIPPVANAGQDQTITLPINSFTLSGSGSDADGTITSYNWTKIFGPSSYTIVNAASSGTSVTGLSQGIYQFRLAITDNNGSTGADTMQVSVNAAPNQPPVAVAGPDQTIALPLNTITLSGTGVDPDGTISGYKWTKVSGPSSGNMGNANSDITSVIGLTQGVYQFQLTVTDNTGATGTDVVLITVNAATNIPPIANAGSDQTIILPVNTITLSGNGSDADGTVVSYAWTQISGPSGNSIVNADSANTSVTGLVQGIYQFQLQVTDNNGAIGTDIVEVMVDPGANIPPVANAGPNQSITLPVNSIVLSGSGSDIDGTVAGYRWAKISGPSSYNIVNANSAIADITGLVQGVYQFQLQVTDNNGAVGAGIVQITVSAAVNLPPVANAGSNQAILLPFNTVTLSGSGSDADGTVASYSWQQISGPSGYNMVNANSPVTDVTNLSQGVYQFELTVTDNNGATGSDIIQITVNAAANMPPTANAGPDQNITLPLNSISLSGSGIDIDGTVIGYLWTKISGPSTYNIANTNSAVTNVTGLVSGVYQFQLKVTDNQGATATDIILVTVNVAANIPPTANAGPDQPIILPVNTIALSGGGSDADGTVISYLWTQISGPSSYSIVNANSPVTDVTGLAQGVYQFQLQVTDNNGAVGTDIMQVTVNAVANIPPVANAGSDQTITLPIDSVTLSGSGTDADGIVVGYLWTKISGSTAFNIVNPTSQYTSVTGLMQGTYLFELQVTDDNGAKSADTVRITVNAATNIPPVANAGPDQTITLPLNTISLFGSGNDVDGTIGSYVWTKISGPSSYNIANANSSATNVTGLVQGVYQFVLRVTDNNGASGIDTIQVTVNIAGNISPVANAVSNKTITLPTNSVTLNGSGTDADGTIAGYSWTLVSGPSSYNIVNPTSASTSITGLVQGVYQFQLQVSDNSGATGTDIAQVTVNAAPNIPPVANAGSDLIITLPINSVTFTGSGTDADGTIAGYSWTKISGSSSYNIVNANSVTTDITGLVKGVYKFQLKVTDNNGATGTDIVKVTVNAAANIPPVADAGPDQSITLPVNTVSLTGSGSDVDGTVTSYAWTKISGPVSYNVVNASSAATNITRLVQGVYQFQLQVIDNTGAIGIDIVQITVNSAPDQLPLALAGTDQNITLPTNIVALSGSGTDTDGTIAGYLWTQISGPTGYTIVNATSAVTNVTGLVAGVYQFQLQVTDNSGGIGTDIVRVNVSPAPNIPPLVNAGIDTTITLPTNSLTVRGSGSDADGTVAGYQWLKISGPASYNIVNATSVVTDITGLVQGIYQFQLTATDNNGATGADVMRVTVNAAPNQPPVANAGPDQAIALPENSLTVSGSGTDGDGTVVSYQWTKISGPVSYNIVNAASAATNITGLVQGVYQLQLKVTDNSGATATDIMQVTVNSAPNIPPVANAGADQMITLPTNSLTIKGAGSDADGTVAKYQWTKISGPSSYNIVSATSAVTNVTGLVQGLYQFQLKVTDNNGAIGTDIIQVTVNAASNQQPVANAGPNQTIILPTNSVAISGNGTDIDGTITGYQWTKVSGPASFNVVNSTQAVTVINGLTQGVYLFELRVTDNNGARGRDTVQITVNPLVDIPPTAHAGADVAITLPINTASLAGSGSDVDGTVVSYQWIKISGPSSYFITNGASPVTDAWGLVAGVYKFEIVVTDNNGAMGRDTMQITVNPAISNIPPIADAGKDQTITLPTNSVTLSGSGSDADGTITGYSWIQISGPSASVIASSNNAITLSSNLVGGTYEFELTVTDNMGVIGKDTVAIIVAEPRLNNSIQSNVITAYPNPVVDITTLEINTTQVYSQLMIVVMDMYGHVVYQNEIAPRQSDIKQKMDMSNFVKGTYVITVYFNDEVKQTIKIIKQ